MIFGTKYRVVKKYFPHHVNGTYYKRPEDYLAFCKKMQSVKIGDLIIPWPDGEPRRVEGINVFYYQLWLGNKKSRFHLPEYYLLCEDGYIFYDFWEKANELK